MPLLGISDVLDGHGPTPPTPPGFLVENLGLNQSWAAIYSGRTSDASWISAAFFLIGIPVAMKTLFAVSSWISHKALYNEDAKQASFMMGTDALSILSFDAETGEEEQAVSEYQPAT